MKKSKKTPLWSVQAQGMPCSYLFGTMHVRDARAFAFIESAKKYLAQCEEFYTEIHFNDLSMKLIGRSHGMPDGQTIESLLGEKKFAKARKQIKKTFKVELLNFNHLLPAVVSNQLIAKTLQSDEIENLDMSLHLFAAQSGIMTKGLETVQEHIHVLENIPLSHQKKQLLELVKNPKKYRKMTQKLADLYGEGDIQAIYKLSKKSIGDLKGLMIYDRNVVMAKRIQQNIQTPAFYAVGAGHLPGKFGIIKLLKDRGLKVKPIAS